MRADFNDIRHPWRRATLGTLDGAVCPRVSLGVCRCSCRELVVCLK